jgi:hypothetical protein
MSANTKKTYEEIETSDELKARGLQRIKRKFRPKKGETTIRDCQVIAEIRIDADLYKFLEQKSENSTIENLLNEILREKFEKEEAKKLSEIKELRTKLLNDTEFLQKLKEKLAA